MYDVRCINLCKVKTLFSYTNHLTHGLRKMYDALRMTIQYQCYAKRKSFYNQRVKWVFGFRVYGNGQLIAIIVQYNDRGMLFF